MPWVEIHVKTNADYAHQLGDQLTLLGAEAITFQDAGNQPIYEPTPGAVDLWQDSIVIGLFDQTVPLKPISSFLVQQQTAGLIQSFQHYSIADQDWERICLESFKPLQFGQRLWICPSWQTPPDPLAVNVILDPGLAFGTGTHATTALCLTWLERFIHNQTCVIDYGCGSGILGLAALKLGAHQVFAVDTDPQALEATQKNASRNHMTNPALITCFPHQLPKSVKADALIANILAQPLIKLAPHFAAITHTHSHLLLSGILLEQIDFIKETYQPWFTLTEFARKDEWVCLSGIRL